MGNFGFSYIGLIYLLSLFIPNIIWSKNQPREYTAEKENKVLLWFERIGQVLVTLTAIVFSDYNPTAFSAWTTWLIASALCLVLYEICWIRYFAGGHTLKDFYGKFLKIPVPLASLPIVAFLLLGIYGKVIWLVVSVVILGIGHIGIHIQHMREIEATK
ncbi:MAG: hypothetical protein PHE93_01005 [Clostridia bacterium]|nr:hypothetical protein [Clostridia bacterium]